MLQDLRRLGETCEYGTRLDEEMRDQFIFTCFSENLRKKLLREDKLTLQKLLEISFIEQQSIQQATVISKGKSIIKNEVIVEEELDESVNKIRQGKKQTFRTPNRDKTREYSRQNPQKSENLCYRCGDPFDRNHMKYCRALGKSCYNCGGEGSFIKCL